MMQINMKLNRTIFLVLLVICSKTARTQQRQNADTTMMRTVVVEQEYNPTIVDAAKINVLPQVEPPVLTKRKVEYFTSMMPASRIPAGVMPVYTGIESRQSVSPGYVWLGIGTYGRLEASADYVCRLSARDRLTLDATVTNMNGKLDNPFNEAEKWKSRFCHTRASLDYRHDFRKSILDIYGEMGVDNFNLLPEMPLTAQNFTSGRFGVKVCPAEGKKQSVEVRAEGDVSVYNRRRECMSDNSREYLARILADVSGHISEQGEVGVAALLLGRFYQHNGFKDYATVDLNPYYRHATGRWDVRVGAHVDLSPSFGKTLRVAPDVTAGLSFAGSYQFCMQATGGRHVNDFRQLEQLNPYLLTGGEASDGQLSDTYEQLNVAVGLKGSPLSGLWFHLFGGWQDLKEELFLRWHSVEAEPAMRWIGFFQNDADNCYAGVSCSYDYRSRCSFSASAVYRHWNGDWSDWKPSCEVNARLDVRPLSALRASIGMRYLSAVAGYGDYTDLYLQGSYEICRPLLVSLKLHNLLNTDNRSLYWGVPSTGFRVTVGAALRF